MIDEVLSGTVIRRCSFMGNLEETFEKLGKESVLEGLRTGDYVVINAFSNMGESHWYEVDANGELAEPQADPDDEEEN